MGAWWFIEITLRVSGEWAKLNGIGQIFGNRNSAVCIMSV